MNRSGPAGAMRRRVVHRVFPSEPASVPAARTWVGDELARAGVRGALLDRVRLLVSELVTNAVRHTGSREITVRVEVARQVEVSVLDDLAAPPRSRRPGPGDTGGRGLLLVDVLADAWGVLGAPPGKWVWFRCSTDHPDPDPTPGPGLGPGPAPGPACDPERGARGG